jgi:chromosomal replication initiation ATPase DnaA
MTTLNSLVVTESTFGLYPNPTARINPIAREVQETFNGIYAQVTSFVNNPNSAINGMIVSGDAGTGKTHTVKQALRNTGHQKNTEYIKGTKLTAASLYVKLYLNRESHRICVFDDCDLIHHNEKNTIIPMMLGAAELGQNREIGWETTRKNALMEEYNVPHSFKFEGSIIWITNDRKQEIGKSIKQWKNAIFSRFNFAECNFTDEQKFMYTIHLVEHAAMLGSNCQEFPGGYPVDIIEQAADYMSENYRELTEVTPRIAIKIADIMHHNADPVLRKSMLRQLWK